MQQSSSGDGTALSDALGAFLRIGRSDRIRWLPDVTRGLCQYRTVEEWEGSLCTTGPVTQLPVRLTQRRP